jgi:carboxyl-terminal processing protease
MTELRKRTDITLNEKQRKQEREDNENQRLTFENTRRKAKGMELLESLKTDEELKKEEDKASDDKEAEEKEKESDALLLETGNILTDLMQLSKIPSTELQQAQHKNQ